MVGEDGKKSRNPVFALEMIQTFFVRVNQQGEKIVAIQYSPWR